MIGKVFLKSHDALGFLNDVVDAALLTAVIILFEYIRIRRAAGLTNPKRISIDGIANMIDSKSLITGLAVILSVLYLGVSGLNLHFNKLNVKNAREHGDFDNNIVLTGMKDVLLNENKNSMNDMIWYFRAKGNESKAKLIEEYQKELNGSH